MIEALNTIVFSMPFLVGMVAGVVAQRGYCWLVAWYQDRTHPLPEGKHRQPAPISRVWLAGIATFLVFGYILVQVNQTEESYRQLGRDVAACQKAYNEVLSKRSAISQENDQLSIEQRELLARVDTAESVWIGQLINPPADIAELELDDPRRQSWNLDVTRVYVQRAERLNAMVEEITERQRELDAQRSANPLPAPTCGLLDDN